MPVPSVNPPIISDPPPPSIIAHLSPSACALVPSPPSSAATPRRRLSSNVGDPSLATPIRSPLPRPIAPPLYINDAVTTLKLHQCPHRSRRRISATVVSFHARAAPMPPCRRPSHARSCAVVRPSPPPSAVLTSGRKLHAGHSFLKPEEIPHPPCQVLSVDVHHQQTAIVLSPAISSTLRRPQSSLFLPSMPFVLPNVAVPIEPPSHRRPSSWRPSSAGTPPPPLSAPTKSR